jgi:hypothetical protein
MGMNLFSHTMELPLLITLSSRQFYLFNAITLS